MHAIDPFSIDGLGKYSEQFLSLPMECLHRWLHSCTKVVFGSWKVRWKGKKKNRKI